MRPSFNMIFKLASEYESFDIKIYYDAIRAYWKLALSTVAQESPLSPNRLNVML